MTCLGYNGSQICIFRKFNSYVCKMDITRIIKEVKRIMLNCQIRDLMDIKLNDYMIWWNNDKLNYKSNKGEGLSAHAMVT